MGEPPRTHGEWMDAYRRRAALDPLRAVLDEGDEKGIKNAWVDFVERRVLRRVLKEKPYRVAVDLGCGVGRLTGLLAEGGARVAALDASEALLGAARRRGFPSGARPVRADLRVVPLRDGAADLVVSCNVLIHMVADEDLRAAAREVARILRPWGRALILEHLSPSGATARREGIVFRSLEDLAGAFESAGLRLDSVRPVRKSPSRILHWVLRGRVPRALWGAAADLEARMVRRGRVLPDYRDHLLVFGRG